MKHEFDYSNYNDYTQTDKYSNRLTTISFNNLKNKIITNNINHKYRTKNSKFQYLIFLIIFFNLIIKTYQQEYTDEDCIEENNKSFDFHKPTSRLISNPLQCTEKTSSCCYIEVNFDYAGHLIDNTFCVLLGGDINARIQQISGILTDQIRYYANFIYNKYTTITSIGNNLDYVFYENYTCYELAKEIDFYYYSEDNCAFSNPDGSCKVVNDFTYKNNYAKLLYKNITNNFCNNRDEFGKCVLYQQSPDYNETGLSPLMEYLKVSLDLNEDSTDKFEEPADDPIEAQKNNTELSKKFYAKCKPIIPATVKIICPSSYINGHFSFFRIANFALLISLLFIIF